MTQSRHYREREYGHTWQTTSRKLTTADVIWAVAMRDSGMSIENIAKRLPVVTNTVRRAIEQADREGATKSEQTSSGAEGDHCSDQQPAE